MSETSDFIFNILTYLTPITKSPFRASMLCTICYNNRFLINTISIVNHLIIWFAHTTYISCSNTSITTCWAWSPATSSPNESRSDFLRTKSLKFMNEKRRFSKNNENSRRPLIERVPCTGSSCCCSNCCWCGCCRYCLNISASWYSCLHFWPWWSICYYWPGRRFVSIMIVTSVVTIYDFRLITIWI